MWGGPGRAVDLVFSDRYADVAPLLASAGYRVIIPYMRGYGTTRFLSSDTVRNGQPSALGSDVIDTDEQVLNTGRLLRPLQRADPTGTSQCSRHRRTCPSWCIRHSQ